MRNKISLLLIGGFLMVMALVPFQASAGFDYKSDVTIDKMDGRYYLRTDCGTFTGDDCTTPGSSSRVDISAVVDVINAISVIKPF